MPPCSALGSAARDTVTKPRPHGPWPAACFVPGEGGPHGVGAIPQPVGLRGADPGRGGCSVSSPTGLGSQNKGCGANWQRLGALGHHQLLAVRFAPLEFGGCSHRGPAAPGPPQLLQADIKAKKAGTGRIGPSLALGDAGTGQAGAGKGAPQAQRPSQLAAHSATPFQPARFFFFFPSRQTRGEAG